jgi:hypothetical protein
MHNYITDLLTKLIDEANEIKPESKDGFEAGKLFGYYECISKIMNQTEAFGLHEKLSKKLQEFLPEDLLKKLNS